MQLLGTDCLAEPLRDALEQPDPRGLQSFGGRGLACEEESYGILCHGLSQL